MNDRLRQREAFIRAAGWGRAAATEVAGDASARRYARLRQGARTAIVMDCPEEAGDIAPFLAIAAHLRGCGLSAPDIFAEDRAAGFILMEDLGDDLYARVLRRDPGGEGTLYKSAVDVLLCLHDCPAPVALPAYDPPEMIRYIAPTFEWYCPVASPDAFAAISAGLKTMLAGVPLQGDVMVLRDYHAENLIWLPGRSGPARTGLLDFQDAMTGHRGYDLMSLLQDARRDVSDDCAGAMVARYARAAGLPQDALLAACAVLGAQRALRILGVFARLARTGGKPQYLDLLPRVWGHLLANLEHPAAAPVRRTVLSALPAPDADHRKWLRCA